MKMRAAFILTTLTAATAVAVAAQGDAATPHDRLKFVELLGKVEVGMTRASIVSILGEPDECRRALFGKQYQSVREVMCYGTCHAGGFPTLGQVLLDNSGRCVYWVGGGGTPPPAEVIGEAELRHSLQLIHECQIVPTLYKYDPRYVITAVNYLQPLGKSKALAVFREYLRLTPVNNYEERSRLYYVTRVLFDIPQDVGHMPRMFIGEFSPPPPKRLQDLPHYPLYIYEDVPCCIASQYIISGVPEDPQVHVDYYEKHCNLRKSKLTPLGGTRATVERIMSRTLPNFTCYPEEDTDAIRFLIRRQVRRMIQDKD